MAMPCVRRAWYCRRHEKVLRKGWVPERDFESTYPPEYRDGRRALLCCLKCFVCHQFLALRCIHCTVHVTRPMLNRICHPNQSSLVVVRVQNSGSIGRLARSHASHVRRSSPGFSLLARHCDSGRTRFDYDARSSQSPLLRQYEHLQNHFTSSPSSSLGFSLRQAMQKAG